LTTDSLEVAVLDRDRPRRRFRRINPPELDDLLAGTSPAAPDVAAPEGDVPDDDSAST
jgi:proteasome alpha subunit